jgi:CheY-like chemotaxis protein
MKHRNVMTPPGKQILIVEDEQPIREMMKTLLEIEGYSISTACNGRDGIERLRENPPSLVLLDMMMPVMNGWDFLDALRSDPATASIPVVIVSAYSEIAKSVRPKAFVPKPVQLDTLLRAIGDMA